MHFKVKTVVWWSNYLVFKGTNFESHLAPPNITAICLSFLVEYFIITTITMAKHAILHLQENEDICLDSGNVTMLLTYCNSKTKHIIL
jgi:hypothetical protein